MAKKTKPSTEEEPRKTIDILPNHEFARLKVGEFEVELGSHLTSSQQLAQLCFDVWWTTKNPNKPKPDYTG